MYEEKQKMTLWWVVLIVVALTSLMWYGFIQQIIYGLPFGTNPASDPVLIVLWVLFGIGFPIFFLTLRLEIKVTDQSIHVQFKPLMIKKQTFLFSEINSIQVETYHPIREFWGYGIRISLDGEKGYNVKGNHGIRIELKNGKNMLIGTQKPDEVKEVLDSIVWKE